MQRVVTSLWFNFNAEEAIEFYTSIFPDSRVLDMARYGPNEPGPEGAVLVINFELFGQRFMAINAGPQFPFTEAISLMVLCESQQEIDHYWAALLAGGGQTVQCGWLKDRFGLSWQVTPTRLLEMQRDPDLQRRSRAVQAMLKMVKLDLAELERAYRGE